MIDIITAMMQKGLFHDLFNPVSQPVWRIELRVGAFPLDGALASEGLNSGEITQNMAILEHQGVLCAVKIWASA